MILHSCGFTLHHQEQTMITSIMKRNMTSDLYRKAGIYAIYAFGLIILLLQFRSIFA